MSATVNSNFQDYDPRHRLTGAIVLLLLAVVFLPMLLSKKPDLADTEKDPVVMEITQDGKKVFVSRISAIPQGSDARATAEQQVEPAQKSLASPKAKEKAKTGEPDTKAQSALFKPVTTASVKKPENTKVSPATKSKKTSTTSSKVEKTGASALAPGAWVLQIGVFAQSANASKKVSELKKKGFDARSEKVKTKKGLVTKVWIGPFKDRETAKRMQSRLQHKTRERGFVVQVKKQ